MKCLEQQLKQQQNFQGQEKPLFMVFFDKSPELSILQWINTVAVQAQEM